MKSIYHPSFPCLPDWLYVQPVRRKRQAEDGDKVNINTATVEEWPGSGLTREGPGLVDYREQMGDIKSSGRAARHRGFDKAWWTS